VVFPDAEVKLYLDADPATRARRRAAELQSRGLPVAFEQVLAEIRRRDDRDRTRADSPLRPAPGAIIIESSHRDAGDVVEEVLRVVRAHPSCPAGPAGGQPPPASPPPGGRKPASGGVAGPDPAD
jgi:cytidylate kinase